MIDLNKIRKSRPVVFWLVTALIAAIVFLVGFYLFVAYLLPLPIKLEDFSNHQTTKIFDRNGILLYEVLQPDLGKKSVMTLAKIPKDFINATLAAEDMDYYKHGALDITSILRALWQDITAQKIVSGASTITQQTVRNITDLKSRQVWTDKLLEMMYSIRIEHIYSKDQILEMYLNRVYYGNLAYGCESAAEDFFGKHIYDLDLAEMTLIAGLPQSPSAYNPFVYFDRAKKRQLYVLSQMVKNGFIDQKKADDTYDEELAFRTNKIKIKAPHFVNYIINLLEEQYGQDMVMDGGLQVVTTLDYNLQLKGEQAIERQVDKLKDHNVNDGALYAVDVPTGQILAYVGSKDYFDKDIDGAVDMVHALRQPGSSIKPLNYLAAFEKGYTPATVLYDIPSQFDTESGPYSPKNYDLKYHGPVRARIALASSFNIPAVKVLNYVGVSNFLGFLKKFGIDTLDADPSFYGLALTLGGGEVRVDQMAEAFNTIANYGYHRDTSVILQIKKSNGEVIFDWSLPQAHNVLGPQGKQHAYQIMSIISDKNARIPGFGEGSILELDRPAAVKTGTTRNFKDNWAIGFTPQLLTAVWVGNADASSMENVSGVDGAAPAWAEFMEGALSTRTKMDFANPGGLKEVEICAVSGMLATDLCNEKVSELFAAGSEPKTPDNYYRKFWINKSNGKIITEACINDYNKALIEQKVLLAYPAELQKWAAQNGLDLPQTEPCARSNDYTLGDDAGKADAVYIDNPAENDEYLIDNSMPKEAQKIPFRVTVPLQTTSVKYYIDGVNTGVSTESPYTYLWVPQKGTHKLKAVAATADGKQIESEVRSFIIN